MVRSWRWLHPARSQPGQKLAFRHAFRFHEHPLSELLPLQHFERGSKRKHLRRIATLAGCSASQLLFFDNELQHCQDAADFGTTAVLCPDGLTSESWTAAVQSFPRPGSIINPKRLQKRNAESGRSSKSLLDAFGCF
eukprot:symbB.v1.2.018530.t1/scaffold1481.1/size116218/9